MAWTTMGEDIGSINWNSIAEWMKKNYAELQTAEPVDTSGDNYIASKVFEVLGVDGGTEEFEAAERDAVKSAEWISSLGDSKAEHQARVERNENFAKFQSQPMPTGEDLYRDKRGVLGPMARAGTEGARSSQADTKHNPHVGEDDYLNQLMMAALMAGGKKGKMGQLGGAAGGGISSGDPWTMKAPWEKDYRYLS